MIPLESRLTNLEMTYPDAKERIDRCGFVLGGNWDYEHGCFDRSLDGENKVWLRVPFEVTGGSLNGESAEANVRTLVQFGTPFILHHQYEEGVDQEGTSGVMRSLVDQFQAPSNPDAPVDDHWISIGMKQLQELESAMMS